MNPCSRRRAGDDPGLAPSAPQLTASQPGHHGAGQRPARVKRRKTKRERNSAKFGRNAAGGPGCRMLQRMPAPGWSSHCAGHAKSTPLPAIQRVSGSRPVIITQHRLSQHLGMFNREVKSADIERLLDPRSERETETETSAALPGAISQAWDPCAPGQTCAPDRQHGTSTPAPHAAGQGPQPTAAPAARELGPTHSETAAVETGESQAERPAPLDEKENVPPSGAEPGGATAAMRELAQELQTHLDLTSMFPGRNLISERRQTILSTLLDRHQTLPDLSALMVHNKPCGGSAQGALRSPGARGQELLWDTGSSGSGNSEQGISGKRRRGQDVQAFRCASPTHTVMKTGERRATRREDLESLGAREPFGRHSLHPTAAPSDHALLSGSALHTGTIATFAPEAPGPLPRAAQCCRRSWEAIWEPRTGLERASMAVRPAQKEHGSEGHGQGHWMPFAAGDSGRSSGLASRSPARCPLAEPPQYPCAHWLSPELWQVLQTQTQTQTQSKRPPPELHASQSTARAGPETQPSCDVLRSIWSPSQAAEVLAPRALAWPRPGHRAVSWELCSEPAPLPQACWQHRQGPRLEPLLPPREARQPRLLSVLGRPGDHGQKPASVEPVRAPTFYQPWDSGARGEGCPRAGGWGSRFPLGGAQQLCALQQLPMSFFPPSEALERGRSPPPTLHGYRLEEGSPEAWVFPRMKLY
ncbi:proline-rich protein 19 isoform X2 [Mauremys reevesii]|nr:proline-rich protein 19 isoform X2 [Mauremys reevesii]XP_039368694.1 proline-rich protein 19 isoform X2 [Mauremys reevesii]XP_039368695.1 proline-rich protein 19 isoform X2 [Mauremys reevesii]